jgi:outer membrane lipoprotein-sorting protein
LKVLISIIISSVFFNHFLFAQTFSPLKDVQGFKAKLQEASKVTKTVESDFVQEKSLSVLSDKIISKGQFCFKKENNVRWEYTLPYKYLIIINNDKIFIKDDEHKKQYDAQSNKMFKQINDFMVGCIQGSILSREKEYKITFFENDKNYYVKLVPLAEKMKQIMNEIQIYFDKKDLSVSKLKMVESGGDYTNIEFSNKKLNIDIPDEKFSFK